MKTTREITIENRMKFKRFDFNFNRTLEIDYGIDIQKICSEKIRIEKIKDSFIELNIAAKTTYEINFIYKNVYVWNKNNMLVSKKFQKIKLTLKNEKISSIKIVF